MKEILPPAELSIHLGLKALMKKHETINVRRETGRRSGKSLVLLRGPLYVDVKVVLTDNGLNEFGGTDMIFAYDAPTLARQFDITFAQAKRLSNKIDGMLV